MNPKLPALHALAALALSLAALAPLAAQRVPAVAVLEMANAGMDPRVDYLAGMLQGLLAYDLGTRSELALVDRRNLDAVLKEQELSLSALGQDADSAAAAGKLAGADWLLSGEYVFLGAEVLVTLSLTNTATAKRSVFRDRGGSENLVHKLAEQVFQKLTGVQAVFADPSRSRSLVSLRDETPGSVALFSPIIKAEIILDGQFVGYTVGDGTVPIILDRLSPGRHTVRVHLDPSFGVVKLPEVSFHDWEAAVDVEPGKRSTLRDGTRHLNYFLYKLIELGTGSVKAADADSRPDAPAPKLDFAKDLGFQDRKGADVAVRFAAKPRLEGDSLTLEISLSAGPKGQGADVASFSLVVPTGEQGEKAGELTAGIVSLHATLKRYSDSWSLDWRLERTDIRQNMWSE